MGALKGKEEVSLEYPLCNTCRNYNFDGTCDILKPIPKDVFLGGKCKEYDKFNTKFAR